MAFKQNPIINDSSLLAMLTSSSSSAPPRLLPGLYEYPSIAGPGKSFYTLVERPHSHIHSHSQIMNNYEGEPDLDEFLVLDVENHDGAIKRGGGRLIAEKKRRLTRDQVRSLESSFDVERKLEPERKNQLALKLGLHPRQVAVWFQNRRARCKTKQLEHDYDRLKQQYDALLADTTKLQSEVARLKELLQQKSNDGNHHEEAGSGGNNASNNRERQHLEEREHFESDRILDEEVSSEEEMMMIMKEHHRHHFHCADDAGSFPPMACHNHHHNNHRHQHGHGHVHKQHEDYPFNISSKEE